MDFLISLGVWLAIVFTYIAFSIIYPLAWAWDCLELFWYRLKTGYFNDGILAFLAVPTGLIFGSAVYQMSQGSLAHSLYLVWLFWVIWDFKQYCYMRWH